MQGSKLQNSPKDARRLHETKDEWCFMNLQTSNINNLGTAKFVTIESVVYDGLNDDLNVVCSIYSLLYLTKITAWQCKCA